MKTSIIITAAAFGIALAGSASAQTAGKAYESTRLFFDDEPPVNAVGKIWVDPLGCEHNIFSDGTEGYMAERLTRDGRAVCGSTPSIDSSDVWIDPDGCAHWFVDSGVEGYLSSIRFPDGRPSCGPEAQQLLQRFPAVQLLATTWRDPNGCFHWIADDGFEGYMSSRLAPSGAPVCEGQAPTPTSLTLAADALFDVDSSELKPEAVEKLTEFFELMNKVGKSRISVIGHTDSDGTEPYNLALSLRRAQSVAAFGDTFEIASLIDGKGETQPVAPNDTRENKAKNRRVEISILD
ncbi:MAG: OmpA family protein [Pseudomonadota bacterium]